MFCSAEISKFIHFNQTNAASVIFISSSVVASDDQKAKLLKLLSLWESKSNLFDACVISKLQSPNSSMAEYKTNLMNTHLTIVTAIQQSTQNTFEKYAKMRM